MDNPFAIDGIYDYEIPPEMAGSVKVGSFVTVPFGTANRTKTALVWELRETPSYPEVKQLKSVCAEGLALDDEMMGLCSFMKQRTLCTTGEAVRSIIPPVALSHLQVCYATEQESRIPESGEMSSSDFSVYSYLSEKPERTEEDLRRRFGTPVLLSLKRLREKKWIRRTERLIGANPEKTRRVYLISIPRETAVSLSNGEKTEYGLLSSRKQKEALKILLDAGEPLSAAEVIEIASIEPDEKDLSRSVLLEETPKGSASPMTEAQLKALEKKGILRSVEIHVERNPYAEAAFRGQTELILNEEQQRAADTLRALSESGEAKAALLFGVTGSGKTSVMTALIDSLLARGKGVILLLPEISLTPQSVEVFCARYGTRVSVIHSGLSQGERYDAFNRIREGKSDFVIGTRSAVFAPIRNLGAIILDEEQEHTYKSDQSPRYHARDIARFRCARHRALMLLASATPSLESFKKAKDGVYTLVSLNHRYGNAVLPTVEICDMRKETLSGNLSPLGGKLLSEMDRVNAAGEQTILFLNRRGYNHFVSCRSCGAAVTCPSCSVAMTFHKKKYAQDGELVCHWCGRRMLPPTVCPSCNSPHLMRMGFGTQKIEEDLQKLFPDKKVLRMDTDTATSKFAYDEMLGSFKRHEADILLGTQMVTKGHNFPEVTLVGVLLADASLYLDDYRAAERTFSMLTQVIGRAGRAEKTGVAVIQTNNPDSEVIRLACEQDYEKMYEREIRLRKALTFPPFCDIALLTLTGTEEGDLNRASVKLAEEVKKSAEGEFSDVSLITFGPFEAPVYRVDNKYRMRMVVKCALNRRTYAFFADLLCKFGRVSKKINLAVDFNPTNL